MTSISSSRKRPPASTKLPALDGDTRKRVRSFTVLHDDPSTSRIRKTLSTEHLYSYTHFESTASPRRIMPLPKLRTPALVDKPANVIRPRLVFSNTDQKTPERKLLPVARQPPTRQILPSDIRSLNNRSRSHPDLSSFDALENVFQHIPAIIHQPDLSNVFSDDMDVDTDLAAIDRVLQGNSAPNCRTSSPRGFFRVQPNPQSQSDSSSSPNQGIESSPPGPAASMQALQTSAARRPVKLLRVRKKKSKATLSLPIYNSDSEAAEQEEITPSPMRKPARLLRARKQTHPAALRRDGAGFEDESDEDELARMLQAQVDLASTPMKKVKRRVLDDGRRSAGLQGLPTLRLKIDETPAENSANTSSDPISAPVL